MKLKFIITTVRGNLNRFLSLLPMTDLCNRLAFRTKCNEVKESFLK